MFGTFPYCQGRLRTPVYLLCAVCLPNISMSSWYPSISGLGNLSTCCLCQVSGIQKKWLQRNALLIRQATPIHKRIGPPWRENTNAINRRYQMEITLTLIDKMQWTGRSLSEATSTQESGNIACYNYACHCATKLSV